MLERIRSCLMGMTRERKRQTDRERERQAERDRQTNRERETDRDRHILKLMRELFTVLN